MKKLLFLFLLFPLLQLSAQLDVSYQKPPKAILDLVDKPLPPSLRINSKGTQAILLYRNAYKSIAELSETELRLAGLRINPKTNISSRERYYIDMKVLDVKTQKEIDIKGLPANARLSKVRWSPDETQIAFTHTTENKVELWVLDLKKKAARKLSDLALNANMGSPAIWSRDSESMLVKVMPAERKELIDAKSAIPTGPTVSENDGKKAQNRTYQDLLKNKTDEFNFEQLATSVMYKIGLDGKASQWRDADMHRSVSFSPDGKYVLLTTIERPFSYLVPYYRFPSHTAVYDLDGKMVKSMLKLPLIEDLPKGFMATRTGMRGISWRSDKPSTLYWTEALDGGDPANEVEYRDAVYQQPAPFTAEKKLLLKTHNRMGYMMWGNDEVAVAYDRWWNNRNTKTYLFDPSGKKDQATIIHDRSYQDRYSDPGNFVTKKNKNGIRLLDVTDGNLHLMGRGYSDEGILPFVDRFEIASGKTTRLWRASDPNTLESLVSAMNLKEGKILTRIESKSNYPNYYFRNINKDKDLTAVTKFNNPFQALQDVHKEVITYKRDDGIELSGTLYLPSGYDKAKKEKLPMILWAYPREFKDKGSAGQVTSSPNSFTYPWYGSPVYWVTQGYAVLDGAAFPIIGEKDEEPNDMFIKQLVANGKAAIDAVDALGYIDRNKVAVGGHSYGAFMTANLLTHSNLFAAGIARSGAYNRTLTPFGFQSEERSYWEAPDVYNTMSPFMNADKMKSPLLLIHGQADNNSGTYPMQSERYFNALKGLGATVRLVMLPKESHGYSARESVLHMLWEQDQWLEKYVKNRVLEEAKVE